MGVVVKMSDSKIKNEEYGKKLPSALKLSDIISLAAEIDIVINDKKDCTDYKGFHSYWLEPIRINNSHPLSGRIGYGDHEQTQHVEELIEGLNDYEFLDEKIIKSMKTVKDDLQNIKISWKNVKKWKGEIANKVTEAMNEYKKNSNAFHKQDNIKKEEACCLSVTFHLDKGSYHKKDLDNLLKPVLDALQNAELVTDDHAFHSIKVRKDIRRKPKEEGITLWCVPTKKFTIIDVLPLKGSELKPYWRNDMQYIIAEDNSNGKKGMFIDNLEGNVFIDGKETKFIDAVPGYPWRKGTIEGCIVTERQHKNEAWEGDELDTFFWLQKWAW
ncbi:MAG: RusA family crossover junction endodeoxyribonuclease [Actinomycetia bacterium]|nr:RusA family crossover junction endodeoxyribonuclease [Actinomycetes bacterium]